ncbi:DUF6428 family protein [Hyunsoonleella rubra]|uniref:DUF6428 family protein n=1 Tax=Hyunsoonleella rubra TaxID=1737062 RepID=A0ABW5TA43_9FLAO
MKTQELFSVLEANKDKALLFEYAPQEFVGANYHITEVKHMKIDAVDCGARSDSWNETIIQLWESPKEKDKTEFMSVLKALGILNKVAKMKPYDLNSEVKFEYSNETFHTAQLFVNDFEIQGHHLIFKLAVQKTDCKAKTLCGVAEKAVEVTETVKEKTEACCTPDSGCC